MCRVLNAFWTSLWAKFLERKDSYKISSYSNEAGANEALQKGNTEIERRVSILVISYKPFNKALDG